MTLDLSILNSAQRQAVTAPEGPALIVAGPGTGKTYTLACRIAYLRQHSHRHPQGVLAVTFTQKAAKEMAARVAMWCGRDSSGDNLWIGTFHRFGLAILRQEGHLIGLNNDFHILSEAEQASLVRSVLKEVLPKESDNQVRRWMRYLSATKHQKLCGATNGEAVIEALLRVLAVYEERLQALDLLDFDDLVLKTIRLLQEAPSVRGRLRKQYDHILVDEYQDINDGQYRLLKELCEKSAHLWVIGDADQAIYAFRGAQTEYFLRFKEDYPDAVSVTLEKNYRSAPAILRGAQAVISRNVNRIPNKLSPTLADRTLIQVCKASHERAEARSVVEEIKNLIGGIHMESSGGYDEVYGFNEIAVLYRLHYLSRPLTEALERSGIPFQVVGGPGAQQNSMLETMLPFLKAIIDPHDDHAIRALLPALDKQFDFITVAGLSQAARVAQRSLYSYLSDGAQERLLDASLRKVLRGAFSALHRYQKESTRLSVPQLLKAVFEGLFRNSAQAKEKTNSTLTELLMLAEPYGDGAACEQLMEFLECIALSREGETYNPRAEAVTLMSVHAAKGLEFPVVFLVGLEDGIFPCSEFGDQPADREEERRLFYVGMTRAKKVLYLFHCRERYLFGERRKNNPSPFIGEIPEGLVEIVRERYDKEVSPKPRVKQRSLF